MEDHFFKPGSSPHLVTSCRVSRRDFLRHLTCLGSVVPASVLLPGLVEVLGLQKAPASAAAGKSQTGPQAAPGFQFTDIAAQTGLGQALNVFGGITRKRYLLEEIGCGLAFFDYDSDGWLDLFLVNGTRFDGISSGHTPTNFLF